jgi:internalin A
MDDLVNLECLYASHNLIKDLFGISQLTTLRELNLSFNQIQDISPLQELTLLEKLFLNRNKISVLDPLKSMTSLQTVGLFHNEIFNPEKSLQIFAFLGINYKLRDISIDGNPISSTTRFKN